MCGYENVVGKIRNHHIVRESADIKVFFAFATLELSGTRTYGTRKKCNFLKWRQNRRLDQFGIKRTRFIFFYVYRLSLSLSLGWLNITSQLSLVLPYRR